MVRPPPGAPLAPGMKTHPSFFLDGGYVNPSVLIAVFILVDTNKLAIFPVNKTNPQRVSINRCGSYVHIPVPQRRNTFRGLRKSP
jgi:hypothetical protein